MRRHVLLLVLAGCRQIFGVDVPPQAEAIDASGELDGPDPVADTLAPASCMTRWETTPVFAAPMPLATLNTAADEDHPFVTANGLSIYFTRAADIYVASRATQQQDFGTATLESSLSSTSNEGKAFINADATRAFFASDRPNGSGGFDLWRGARNGSGGAFSVDRGYVGPQLDDAGSQVDPHMSPDLLHLYFIPGSGPTQHIALSTRGSTSADFQTPATLLELAGSGSEAGPTLTDDERVIVFSSTRNGGEHLFYAFRATSGGTFSTPKPVPQLGSNAIDGAPHLSGDGCRLYFMSTRNGSRDLFVATML